MKVSELMAGYTPSPDATGIEPSNRTVVAIGDDTTVSEYFVADEGIVSQTISFNPSTKDESYIRKGMVSTKTGNQVTVDLEGVVVNGDEFQEACRDMSVAFGVGNAVIKNAVVYSLDTGKGYQGKVSVIVNGWGGGSDEDNAPFSVSIRFIGVPTEYTYSAL